ncbi:MAG: thioredoxin domain-containing protein [Sulfuricella sp.]|nr:thioredoxin domain-containing protein [Sulfuricella sp.]
MPNHLVHETSPYLQQHAHNPVDWHPWSAAVFAEAQRLNKPVLLSIGYSTCHWCHVMAAESFEDNATAARMNELFINVKVDREERPDLDQIYQSAHAMLTGRPGGWPLTMFLSPDQTPFFGGTYFPKSAHYGLPAFGDLLDQLATAFQRSGSEIRKQNDSLRAMLVDSQPRGGAKVLDERPLRVALRTLEQAFDPVDGGFGDAPKFPKPADLTFCLRRFAASSDEQALAIALFTLKRLCDGGIADQLGGGFFRYSVDKQWMIPHFEKMLYDNAQLLDVLALGWQSSGAEPLRRAAEALVAWLQREMFAPGGGFYSALDADSEHVEGKFYVWTPHQVALLLTPEEYALCAPHFGLDRPANFEGKHWHLHVFTPLEKVAESLGIAPEIARRRLDSAKAKLLAARTKRIRPSRDDKQLTAWNALTAKALANAGRIFGKPEWVALARGTVDFLRATMWRDGVLHASHTDGQTHLNGYLDDYAFLLDALLAQLQAEFRRTDLFFACTLADALLDEFEDHEKGGFYFTAHRHETLISRPKPGADSALPAGNAVAARALQQLGHLLGVSRYLVAAERALRLFYPEIAEHSASYTTFLSNLEEYLTPPAILVLRGPVDDLPVWRAAVEKMAEPSVLCITLPNGSGPLPGGLNKPESATVNAWLCQGVNCLPPIAKPEELHQVFKAGKLG